MSHNRLHGADHRRAGRYIFPLSVECRRGPERRPWIGILQDPDRLELYAAFQQLEVQPMRKLRRHRTDKPPLPVNPATEPSPLGSDGGRTTKPA
jgi:hypothetical protein